MRVLNDELARRRSNAAKRERRNLELADVDNFQAFFDYDSGERVVGDKQAIARVSDKLRRIVKLCAERLQAQKRWRPLAGCCRQIAAADSRRAPSLVCASKSKAAI